jgi:tRNA (cmo5U34)-methyltransferase
MQERLLRVGEGIAAGNASWTFGGETPKKFNDHVKRSVPFYEAGHALIAQISDFFVKPNSVCYELGVSTAVLMRKLAARQRKKPNVRWVGIDIEPNMIEQARLELANSGEDPGNIELVADDINLFPYEASDFIVAYYTVQFVPPRLRQDLIRKIYDSLNWGGAFVMFEKVRSPDARFQDLVTTIYTDYKLEQGYTPEEVIGKTQSLKGVLEPFSTQGNIDLLRRAGFVDHMTVFKYVCFEGFLCIK